MIYIYVFFSFSDHRYAFFTVYITVSLVWTDDDGRGGGSSSSNNNSSSIVCSGVAVVVV